MGRPPSNGAPAFRFNPIEVAQMEAVLQEHQGHMPARELLVALAEKFSNSPERSGKITVQMKQVWNWFQNRRYALRSKLVKSPGKLNISPLRRDEVAEGRNVPLLPRQISVLSGHNVVRSTSETPQMEFEAKSARDGAWYDVQALFSHRYLETGNPEVLVRFCGFGQEEDEWVNVRKHVRPRSLPCESLECAAVLPGDLILCFQEGKEQALYFDAHVLDAQRRKHDVRGCRCRFLVRYDHDQSEEIVPLRKICRRPETDYRLHQLHAANETASSSASANPRKVANSDPSAAVTIAVPPQSNMRPGPTIPGPTQVQVPEQKKVEGISSGGLAGGAACRANISSSGVGSGVLEPKEAASRGVGPVTFTGSHLAVSQLEKVECSALGVSVMEEGVAAAAAGSYVDVPPVAGGSSVTVLTETEGMKLGPVS